MRTEITAAVSVICATAMLSIASPVLAKGLTRAQVLDDSANYMKTHEWSEPNGWQRRPGVSAPAEGAKTKAEINAETVAFLRNHRWDEPASSYVPLESVPSDVSKVTREQVQKEAAEYHRTHAWDEAASKFVPSKP